MTGPYWPIAYQELSYDNCKEKVWYSSGDRHTLNDEYEDFVTAHRKAAAECIPTKPRAKCSVPWEAIAITRKQDKMK